MEEVKDKDGQGLQKEEDRVVESAQEQDKKRQPARGRGLS